jgi:hypothetical protein
MPIVCDEDIQVHNFDIKCDEEIWVHNFDIECKNLFQTTKTNVEALNQLVAHVLHFFLSLSCWYE